MKLTVIKLIIFKYKCIYKSGIPKINKYNRYIQLYIHPKIIKMFDLFRYQQLNLLNKLNKVLDFRLFFVMNDKLLKYFY